MVSQWSSSGQRAKQYRKSHRPIFLHSTTSTHRAAYDYMISPRSSLVYDTKAVPYAFSFAWRHAYRATSLRTIYSDVQSLNRILASFSGVVCIAPSYVQTKAEIAHSTVERRLAVLHIQ